MTNLPSFDDIDDDGEDSSVSLAQYTPFQFLPDLDDDEAVLAWLNDNFDHCYQGSKDRLMTYRRLANRYKNAAPPTATNRNSPEGSGTDKPTIRTNFSVEYLDQKVSQVSKTKQNPTFIPLNDSEQDDINDAEACNMLVKFRMTELDFPMLMRRQDRKTFKYGHSFAKVYWDECAGPVRKEFSDLEKRHGEIPFLDKDDKPVKGKKATKYDAKLGDVGLKICDSDCIFPERKKKDWERVDFVDEVEFVNINELKADYPDATVIKEDYHWLDVDNRGYNHDDQVLKHMFYHRPTKHLEHGEVIIYIESGILERIRDPKEIKKHMPDEQLPFVPDTDIDVDDEFWARPFLINIEQHNNMYDLVQSGMARNIGVASHPKLLIAEGSVNLKQADNKYGVMQWRGAHKPEWMQHNYINRGEFEIQDRLEKRMDKAAKVYDISKGQVPVGITATSAMRLLDDQELQANSEAIEKRRTRITNLYWKVLQFMDANYQEDDERMSHILGENNEYLIQSFKKKPNFKKMHSCKIENLSALSDTRSGRVSDIIDLNAANQKEPTFGRKEIIKLLDLGLEKAFVDEISQAATTAKILLDMLKHGKDALPPEMSDDLLEMYSIFSRFTESVTYKLKLKAGTRKAVKDYITGLEYLMCTKSKMNALFAMRVKEFAKYPMFYTPGAEITAMPAPMPGAPAGGGAAGGLQNMNEKAQKELAPEMNGGSV